MNRFTKVLVILLSIGFPALSAGEGSSESISADRPVSSQQIKSDMPVKAVTLYSAGLAQIVQETEVTGNEVLLFPVEHKDVNDILKSLRVEDLDGGRVDSVNFASENPLNAVLSDMRVNPSGSPGIRQFLSGTQGEQVTVANSEGDYSGYIFSVEDQRDADGNSRTILNLMNADGLRSIDISTLVNLKFSDETLQEELLEALGEIARSRIKSSRLLKISLKGEGTRTVRLSYIRAVPLWKTSYRIVIDQEGTPRLEGWALVQNTGSEAWEDVNLSFVAGQPNAFIMDLASPRYVHRDTVDIPTAGPLGAVEYDRGIAPSPNAGSAYKSMAAPSVMYEESEMMMDDYYGYEESYEPAPMQSRATAVRSGNYYRYTVDSPVTVESRSSAMIPIISTENVGTTLGIYDPSSGGLVFKSIRLENDGDAHWAAGPVSVSEGRSYAGDALIPDMIPGSKRFLSYAVHGNLEVQKSVESLPQRIISLKISDGLLERVDKMERESHYTVSGEEKELILIHPKESGWSLTENPEIDEETPTAYRFTLESWDDPILVKEEYIISRDYGLRNLSINDFSYYLEWGNLSKQMKEAFQKMSSLKRQSEQLRSESSSLTAQISRLERDQNRVRENMKVLDQESDLFAKYAAQLEKQEEDIQNLNSRVEEKQAAILKADRELINYIASVELD
ncbi:MULTISPECIES: hypothetical protein [unclassified Oceanispirochaeta]|uniref:hypothetical protein n=1 Tax=unclassified Oceanispirochaeta TaxID=2635722 RepID=UPI000E097A2E|nr:MULTISPECIES: hypothetical protein [unclassified Oceanispirochaeta]MBF9016345.1 hypothetical protein [Oceanispirochaeta sp. M2]NPD72807.1 hypothetical protein [Oceanispirochaeta sp. M1]RDG31651.1 hypothetical protein DV872_11915 [Oceanispirochaeta sp. M1]